MPDRGLQIKGTLLSYNSNKLDFHWSIFVFFPLLAPVPGKAISANRGLNLANRG